MFVFSELYHKFSQWLQSPLQPYEIKQQQQQQENENTNKNVSLVTLVLSCCTKMVINKKNFLTS